MSTPGSFKDPAGRELLADISKIRRMSSGDSQPLGPAKESI